MRFDQAAASVRKDNELLSVNIKDLELNNDNVRRKIQDLENYLNKLNTE